MVDEAREDCRALLRGAVFIGDATTDAAVDSLRRQADEAAVAAAAAVEGRAGGMAEAVARLEACMHAISAASRSIGRRPCAPLAATLTTSLPAVAQLAHALLARGDGRGRGLLCTALILVGAFASWFAAEGSGAAAGKGTVLGQIGELDRPSTAGQSTPSGVLAAVLPMVLGSLSVSEVEPSGVWPLRSKQEHAGCVAMMKLASVAPAAVLRASRLPPLLSAIHAVSFRPPASLMGPSQQSISLLLQAVVDLSAHVATLAAHSAESVAVHVQNASFLDAAREDMRAWAADPPVAAAGAARAPMRPPSPEQLAYLELAHDLLLPQVAAMARAEAAGSRSDAMQGAMRLATLLRRLPPPLAMVATPILAPCVTTLVGMIGTPPPGSPASADELTAEASLVAAAYGCLCAFCVGCGSHAAPLLGLVARTAWQGFRPHPLHALQLAQSATTAAAKATVAATELAAAPAIDGTMALTITMAKDAAQAVASLLVRLGGVLATLPPAPSADADAEQQAILARWFDLVALCGDPPASGAHGGKKAKSHAAGSNGTAGNDAHEAFALAEAYPQALATIFLPAMPSALQSIWNAIQRQPTPDTAETQQGAQALRAALALLPRLTAPSALAFAFRASLWGCSADTSAEALAGAANAAVADGREVPGAALLRALVVGLSSWMPSWVLSDVVGCLWALRQVASADFAHWLHVALLPEGVPRPGLTADGKAAFQKQILEAPGKAAFKAAIKQMCGGKKKQTAGTPPVGS